MLSNDKFKKITSAAMFSLFLLSTSESFANGKDELTAWGVENSEIYSDKASEDENSISKESESKNEVSNIERKAIEDSFEHGGNTTTPSADIDRRVVGEYINSKGSGESIPQSPRNIPDTPATVVTASEAVQTSLENLVEGRGYNNSVAGGDGAKKVNPVSKPKSEQETSPAPKYNADLLNPEKIDNDIYYDAHYDIKNNVGSTPQSPRGNQTEISDDEIDQKINRSVNDFENQYVKDKGIREFIPQFPQNIPAVNVVTSDNNISTSLEKLENHRGHSNGVAGEGGVKEVNPVSKPKPEPKIKPKSELSKKIIAKKLKDKEEKNKSKKYNETKATGYVSKSWNNLKMLDIYNESLSN